LLAWTVSEFRQQLIAKLSPRRRRAGNESSGWLRRAGQHHARVFWADTQTCEPLVGVIASMASIPTQSISIPGSYRVTAPPRPSSMASSTTCILAMRLGAMKQRAIWRSAATPTALWPIGAARRPSAFMAAGPTPRL